MVLDQITSSLGQPTVFIFAPSGLNFVVDDLVLALSSITGDTGGLPNALYISNYGASMLVGFVSPVTLVTVADPINGLSFDDGSPLCGGDFTVQVG